jgi:pSer/pThr/pTyr-binding forkhead associated (FHA) protein
MHEYPLLIPVTDAAKDALDGSDQIAIDRLPFRIGRESRMGVMNGIRFYLERRKHHDSPSNDLYINDDGTLLHVSRRHAEIDIGPDGDIIIRDLGSRCGTLVDGVFIGGKDEPGSRALSEGSEISIGTANSPYRFVVRHLDRIGHLVGTPANAAEPTPPGGR